MSKVVGGTTALPSLSVRLLSVRPDVSFTITFISLMGLSSLSVTVTIILLSTVISLPSGSSTLNFSSSYLIKAPGITPFSSSTVILFPFTSALPSLSVISSERGGTVILPFSSVIPFLSFSEASLTVTLTSLTATPSLSRTVTEILFA